MQPGRAIALLSSLLGLHCLAATNLLTTEADGATIDAPADAGEADCGTLVPPSILSCCRACRQGQPDCQPNGCYGGYWCDPSPACDCAKPPAGCSGASADPSLLPLHTGPASRPARRPTRSAKGAA